jgi:hypothetical protein
MQSFQPPGDFLPIIGAYYEHRAARRMRIGGLNICGKLCGKAMNKLVMTP